MSAFDALQWLADNGASFVFLRPRSKRPLEDAWTEKPHGLTEARQHLAQGGNVGFLTGIHSSGLCALDIDCDFARFLTTFPQLAGGPRIARQDAPDRGKLLLRAKGRIPDPQKWKPIPGTPPWAEWLATGNQAVVPPSIHPEGQPFVILNADQPIPSVSPDEIDAIWRKWTNTHLVAPRKPERPRRQRDAGDADPELDRIKDEIRGRFDMVTYACQELQTTSQRESAEETRVLGQGGMLINHRLNIWNTFGEDGSGHTGGDCFALVAYLKYNSTDLVGDRFLEILRLAADYTGTALPPECQEGHPERKIVQPPPPPMPPDAWTGEPYQPANNLQPLQPDNQTEEEEAPNLGAMSAYELLTTDWPEPTWAIPGLLPAGLTILGGRQKLGKSWLSLQLSQAVALGGMVLGERVQHGSVLYLALEDNWRRLQARMLKQQWPRDAAAVCDFLTLREFIDNVGDLRNGGGKKLAKAIAHKKYRLVVIDTLSRAIWGNQSDVDEMTRWLSPLQLISLDTNCAIVLVDHHRKTMGTDTDVISDLLGSQAKGGVADTIWGLYRERGKPGAKLAITGRDVEERTLALSWDHVTGCWQLDGNAEDIALTDQRAKILDALHANGPSSLTAVVQFTGEDKGNTYKRLQDLVAAHLVWVEGSGRGAKYELAPDARRAYEPTEAGYEADAEDW